MSLSLRQMAQQVHEIMTKPFYNKLSCCVYARGVALSDTELMSQACVTQ